MPRPQSAPTQADFGRAPVRVRRTADFPSRAQLALRAGGRVGRRLLNPGGPAKPRDQLGHQVTHATPTQAAEPPGAEFRDRRRPRQDRS